MKTTVLQSLKRTMAAVALTLGLATGLSAQNGPCNNPPNCIVNNEVGAGGVYADMNSSPGATVNGWYVSHGDPSLFGNDCPTSSNNYSIWMWSYLHASGVQQGEGVYTCFNFQQGQTYTVCLWVRNTNNVSNGGHLRVLAANGLTNTGPTSWSPIATPTSSQLISASFTNNQTWTQETYTFTANQNYAELWIYPFMPANPVNGHQYELQIDDIRVSQGASQGQITISATPSTIDWCQSSVLSINGAPAGTTVTWAPSTGLSSTTGLSVLASPCATTTYTATVTVPGGNPGCPSCGTGGGTFTISQQIIVNQPSFQIVGNPNLQCGQNLDLSAVPTLPCSDITYQWFGPNGLSVSGPNLSVGPVDATYAGTYTLVVTNQNGGCSYTTTIDVSVYCPCEANPDFKWDGCNPVSFFGTNNSLGSSVIAWFWDFGDGQTSTVQNPVHFYGQAGSYKVCLTVLATNNAGETCCNQICYDVKVCEPGPCQVNANFGTRVDFNTNTVYFTDLSTGTGTACTWFWDFGDGNTSTLQSPVHTYGGPGFYYVCLRVQFCIYNAAGELIDKCESTYCQWINISQFSTSRQSGTQPPLGDDEVKVFPNPASTELFIAAQENMKPAVRIMNVAGQEVMRAELSAKNLYRVDISTLASGLYMVEVMYPDGSTKHVQFVKSHE